MRQTRCKRNQTGGGLGGVVLFNPDKVNEVVANGLAWKAGGSCLAETRPGYMLGGYPARGLPGMMGGARKKGRKGRKGRKSTTRKYKQAGGRYGFDGSAAGLGGGAPWSGTYAPVERIACEASRSAIPDSGASGYLNTRDSYLWSGAKGTVGQMGGGAMTGAPITWPNHGGASGSPSEMVPTARYAQNVEPPILTAGGTYAMVNTPLRYTEMNPACLKTGGGRKGSKSRRSSKKSKKSKSRKGSRKH